ncbi:hypothetical protein ACE1ET_00385 [Saccharicrinis sp. FJH62]|uniref:hypothetical protein n=1 Tax=Saccharicrinis sp. FJH62 TaxID=3344657 RepID=UPI0035D45680
MPTDRQQKSGATQCGVKELRSKSSLKDWEYKTRDAVPGDGLCNGSACRAERNPLPR